MPSPPPLHLPFPLRHPTVLLLSSILLLIPSHRLHLCPHTLNPEIHSLQEYIGKMDDAVSSYRKALEVAEAKCGQKSPLAAKIRIALTAAVNASGGRSEQEGRKRDGRECNSDSNSNSNNDSLGQGGKEGKSGDVDGGVAGNPPSAREVRERGRGAAPTRVAGKVTPPHKEDGEGGLIKGARPRRGEQQQTEKERDRDRDRDYEYDDDEEDDDTMMRRSKGVRRPLSAARLPAEDYAGGEGVGSWTGGGKGGVGGRGGLGRNSRKTARPRTAGRDRMR